MFTLWHLGIAAAAAVALLYVRLPGYFHARVLASTLQAIFAPRRLASADEEIVLHERVWLGDVDFNMCVGRGSRVSERSAVQRSRGWNRALSR